MSEQIALSPSEISDIIKQKKLNNLKLLLKLATKVQL